MPYIKQEDRKKFEWLRFINIENCGEMNYVLTEIVKKYIHDKGEQYQTYNDIEGAFSLCLKELYRRKVAQYEDKKIEENGDVW